MPSNKALSRELAAWKSHQLPATSLVRQPVPSPRTKLQQFSVTQHKHTDLIHSAQRHHNRKPRSPSNTTFAALLPSRRNQPTVAGRSPLGYCQVLTKEHSVTFTSLLQRLSRHKATTTAEASSTRLPCTLDVPQSRPTSVIAPVNKRTLPLTRQQNYTVPLPNRTLDKSPTFKQRC